MRLRLVGSLLAALLLVSAAPVQLDLVAAPPMAPNTTFYVAPEGSDSNPGTLDRPWRTIQKAAKSLRAGQTVYIKNGIYREHVVPAYSGATGRPIAYRAYPGHRPVLDGATLGNNDKGLFEIIRQDHIEVSGLTIRNSHVAGIHVRGSVSVQIRKNRIERSASSGIGIWRSRDVVVEGNVLVDCRIDPLGGNEMLTIADVNDFAVRYNEITWTDKECCGATAAIDVKQSSTGGTVAGNQLHDLPGTGIYLDAWDGYASGHHVAGNMIYNANTGISLGAERGGTLSEIDVYNNVIEHMRFSGIRFQDVGGNGLREKVRIYHNTIVGSYGHGGAGVLVASDNVRQISLTNNLIRFGPDTVVGQIKAYTPAAISSQNNLVYGPKEQTADARLVEVTAGTITADPRFLDELHRNYHLRAISPARDRGTLVDLGQDHDGAPRPVGAGYDIGAYEYWVLGPMDERAFLPVVVQR